jgi:hypothetical protein
MPPYLSIIFILALISALFPSADGAITALTSSFCIDIVGMQRNTQWDEAKKKKIRQRIHLGFAVLFLIIVLVFKWIDNKSIIDLFEYLNLTNTDLGIFLNNPDILKKKQIWNYKIKSEILLKAAPFFEASKQKTTFSRLSNLFSNDSQYCSIFAMGDIMTILDFLKGPIGKEIIQIDSNVDEDGNLIKVNVDEDEGMDIQQPKKNVTFYPKCLQK